MSEIEEFVKQLGTTKETAGAHFDGAYKEMMRYEDAGDEENVAFCCELMMWIYDHYLTGGEEND